ncbi:MAG: hypothetical protein IJ733_11760 [Lachnospiraceae bacterium]|nr:hypothetical protein [Lachnospiraceae bacterium]
MKKNLVGVVAALIAVVGLVFGILSFVKVQKSTSQIDELSAKIDVLTGNIEDIADSVDLEIDTSVEQDGKGGVTIADMEPVKVSFTSAKTYNLVNDGSKKERFAKMSGYTLYLNKNADDFSEIKAALDADHAQIDGVISEVISSHTYKEAETDLVVKESLKKINKLLGSKIAVQLVLDGYVRN